MTILLAEFIRRQHATRSRLFAREPGLIGLDSPRTGLLPARLFGLLGDICHSHGQRFEDAMKLPKLASGMGTDDAHPRFVACMLRVGDLLDLDNGRFCPVMQRMMGAVPASSQAHVEKHAAIKHVLVSPELIEVDAECETYPGYEATWQWLDWLQQEIQRQMLHWNDIAPRGFGSLPSLGRIETRQHNYLALQPGQRPRFEVDREATLKLLQGANLYPNREDAIRELIQNAIDASLLRLWAEQWSRLAPEEQATKEPRDVRTALAGYPIEVTTERLGDGEEWRITIQDHGTGIAFADLRYLLTVGSSRKNAARSLAIQQMPEWMRPSGVFGIGLQSAFLITQELVLTTRHHDTGEAYEITLRADETSDANGLQIRRLEGPARAAMTIGTRISLVVKTGRFPADITHPYDSGEASRLVTTFDPTVSDELPYFVARVHDLVRRLATQCLGTLILNAEAIAGRPADEALEFDRMTGCELGFKFSLNPQPRGFLESPATTWYRGAAVKRYPEDMLLTVTCNMHFGRADQVLALDRGSLTPSGTRELHRRLDDAIRRLLPGRIARLRSTDVEQAQVASLAAHLFGIASGGDDWRELRIGVEPSTLTLGELIAAQTVTHEKEHDLGGEHLSAVRSGSPMRVDGHERWPWLALLLSKHSFSCSYDCSDRLGPQARIKSGHAYIYEKGGTSNTISDRGLLSVLQTGASGGFSVPFRRSTIPCQRGFEPLKITEDVEHPGFEELIPSISPRMVNPFVSCRRREAVRLTVPHVAALVDWTHAHAAPPASSKAEIAAAVLAFITKVDALLQGQPSAVRDYDLARIELELGKFIDQ